jgi:hypothetical protein
MTNKMPHFKFRPGTAAEKYVAHIKLQDEVIHHIRSLEIFYKYFGFTPDHAKSGVLPDEFVWQEYINGDAAALAPCAQMHIIRYLEAHSDKFKDRYGSQCKDWFAAHAKERLERGIKCAACKMKPFCQVQGSLGQK